MKRYRLQLLLVPVLLVLSSCELIFERPIPPRLVGTTVEMEGIDQKTTQVNADGFWQVVSSSSWLNVYPSSGTGPTTVQLTVETSGLTPDSYSGGFTFSDSEVDRQTFIPVVFSFPQLRGQVVREGAAVSISTQAVPALVPSGPGRLLVGLRAPESAYSVLSANEMQSLAAGVSAVVPQAALKRTFPSSRVAVYETSNRRVTAEQLLKRPEVLYVEPDIELELLAVNDTYRYRQWALDTIDADRAWDVATGASIRIAVIDQGFHPNHPDLRNNVSYAYDFGDQSAQIVTTNGTCGTHGDHVAGIAAAEANNSQGVAGVSFDSSLLLLDVATAAEPDCTIYASSMIAALDWATGGNDGPRADVVNISIGTTTDLSSLHSAVIAAYDAGVTIVAAAGNKPDFTEVTYPAKYPEVIAVAATGPADELASYSVTGPEVWMSAPGGNSSMGPWLTHSILSTFTDNSGYTYGYMDGTSMASPAVAGAAALILSVNPNLSPADVADILAQSSVDLGDPGWDEEFGYGRLDAGSAVSLAQSYLPSSMTYLVKSGDGRARTVPADGQFDFGYTAPGPITLEAFTDDDGDGILRETGEYYGTAPHTVEFDGPIDFVQITVSQQ